MTTQPVASTQTVTDESPHEQNLGGQLLASVSRSFYLTLKALPRELREPISLAYLLARTADTIADTTEVDTQQRLRCLQEYALLLQTPPRDTAAEHAFAQRLVTDFSPHQTNPAEKALMLRTEDAFAWLATMRGQTLIQIQGVLATIISGQKLDLEKFPGPSPLHSLSTAHELDDYTYRVAGCVGEFWTQLCFSELEHVFQDRADPQQLAQLGIQFGKGLQLVNILRDIGKDAALGRCYLPEEEWSSAGLSLTDIAANPAKLRPVWTKWAAQCEDHLHAGLTYLQAINHTKLRYATALPLILAARTLTHLRKATDAELNAGVKISRLDVAKVLFDTTLNNSPSGLERLFKKQLAH